jgi:hypothetical protein
MACARRAAASGKLHVIRDVRSAFGWLMDYALYAVRISKNHVTLGVGRQ